MAYTIILADDSPSYQKILRMAFPSPEYELITFTNGADLLEGLERLDPDVILLSLSLPGKDAYEVGSSIRTQERLRGVPLVLMKEAFVPLDKERLSSVDHEELVQKPFDSQMLAQRIRALIESRKIPASLPEEPVLKEEGVAGAQEGPEKGIREMIRAEVLEMERELEKRMKARILAEIKMWLIDRTPEK